MMNKQANNVVTVGGKTVTLTQDAYIDDRNGAPYYRAHAKDDEGNDYRIHWEITGDINDPEESNLCDWANPCAITEE